MQVLSGIMSVFFIVADMGLWFWFVHKTLLIIQGCFFYCWTMLAQSQEFFFFSPHSTSKVFVGGQNFGREHSWDSWPKGYPRSCSAYKPGEEEGREDVQSNVVFSPKTPLNVMEPCFSGDGWTPASPQEAVNAHLSFALLICTVFASLV